MKKKIAAIAIAITMFVVGGMTVIAAGVVQEIKAQIRPDFTIIIDGEKTTFADVNGNTVYPVLYNGTTYLPLRAIGGLMGKEVGWDGANSTVTLSGPAFSNETPKETTQPVKTDMTIGQKNALSKAKAYLSFSAFSYKGLINQLEYDKFSHEDAVYAAENCGADWSEQAAKKAKAYLDFSSFSREGLIKQLEYEGFTHEQAVYGVEANGY